MIWKSLTTGRTAGPLNAGAATPLVTRTSVISETAAMPARRAPARSRPSLIQCLLPDLGSNDPLAPSNIPSTIRRTFLALIGHATMAIMAPRHERGAWVGGHGRRARSPPRRHGDAGRIASRGRPDPRADQGRR